MPEIKVIMPQMGESIVEGTITKWLKQVGDPVERDEPLFEISTDKIDSEIPAPSSGILSKILHAEDETVEINTVVALIESSAGDQSRADSSAAPSETEAQASEESDSGPKPAVGPNPRDRAGPPPRPLRLARPGPG